MKLQDEEKLEHLLNSAVSQLAENLGHISDIFKEFIEIEKEKGNLPESINENQE